MVILMICMSSNLNKVEAYQKLIRVIDGEIKDCERCHNVRDKKMLNKD